jgi:hypothetical protein
MDHVHTNSPARRSLAATLRNEWPELLDVLAVLDAGEASPKLVSLEIRGETLREAPPTAHAKDRFECQAFLSQIKSSKLFDTTTLTTLEALIKTSPPLAAVQLRSLSHTLPAKVRSDD